MKFLERSNGRKVFEAKRVETRTWRGGKRLRPNRIGIIRDHARFSFPSEDGRTWRNRAVCCFVINCRHSSSSREEAKGSSRKQFRRWRETGEGNGGRLKEGRRKERKRKEGGIARGLSATKGLTNDSSIRRVRDILPLKRVSGKSEKRAHFLLRGPFLLFLSVHSRDRLYLS